MEARPPGRVPIACPARTLPETGIVGYDARSTGAAKMPKPRRRETDSKIFVAGLKDHPDDLIISMAVMNRVATPMARNRKASELPENSRHSSARHALGQS